MKREGEYCYKPKTRREVERRQSLRTAQVELYLIRYWWWW
jgi:hypothetical protein